MYKIGKSYLSLMAGTVMLTCASHSAEAHVTSFDIQSTTLLYDGKALGKAGSYERVDAIAHFAVDPTTERAKKVVDIDKAPVNEKGEVEFSTEVTILRPSEIGKTSSTLLYDIANRGRNLAFPLLNLSASPSGDFTVDDPGDGFLMSRGYTIVWSGWQTGLGDDLIDMNLPVLKDVTGPSREEFVFDDNEAKSTATLSYPAADLDPSKATLTVREKASNPRKTVEGLSFRYVDPSTIEITRPKSMDAGAIYEFIYQAKDALPSGLAFIGTADLVSFLRGSTGHNAEDPVEGIEHTIALGISQSGRYLRDFIYQGFNADETGKQVFDGAMPHIAGSRKTFTNYRFAQPGRFSREHQDHDFPGDQFPFTYVDTIDPVSGKKDSILDACSATETCPKVIQSDTSMEFWQARASLLTTSLDGKPLDMPESVRLFFLASAPHFNAWGAEPKATPTCVYDNNPLSVAPTMRALLVGMDEWVSDGKEPPVSVYPSLADDNLVKPEDLVLPKIDGATPVPVINRLAAMDYLTMPPTAGDEYPVFVPKVDEDGISQGGVEEPYIAVPTGTYFGWNLRDEGYSPGELCGLTGSYISFPEKATDKDSREPLETRYENAEAYKAAVMSSAESLVSQRLMLPEDVDYVIKDARFKKADNDAGSSPIESETVPE